MNEHLKTFDIARKLFPGSKRGNANEFQNFAANSLYPKNKLCKYSIKEVLPLLAPAIKTQIQWRKEAKAGEFREGWKNFQTWINDQYWEFEPPIKVEIRKKNICHVCGGNATGQANKKWHCPEHSPYARPTFKKYETPSVTGNLDTKGKDTDTSLLLDVKVPAIDKAGAGLLSAPIKTPLGTDFTKAKAIIENAFGKDMNGA